MSTANTTTAAKSSIVDTVKGYMLAVKAYFIGKYTWAVSKLPTKLAYGFAACALLIGGLAYIGSRDAPAPEALVENARTRLAPLASADDGVAQAATYVRDGVDSGIDAIAAYLGW
jgi:hypothetical protein